MNLVDELFREFQEAKKTAFMPFVTAGDPNLRVTDKLIGELVTRGANLIEIGFSYSDPIADGSVIQASYTRALQKGLHVDDVFDCIRKVSKRDECKKAKVPLVGMASFSLVYRRGPERFIQQAKEAGFSGVIIPDLPLEEAEKLLPVVNRYDFRLMQLVTPTTPKERATRIAQSSTGFLYCVSVTGITGTRDKLPEQLLDQLAWLRTQTNLPLCVGFGISKPEHVLMLKDVADGVIVGSAIVRQLEKINDGNEDEIIRGVGDYVESLIDALQR